MNRLAVVCVDWDKERYGPVSWSRGHRQGQPRSMLEGKFWLLCFHSVLIVGQYGIIIIIIIIIIRQFIRGH